MEAGKSAMKAAAAMVLAACLSACSTRGYEGPERSTSDLATIFLYQTGRLRIIAVDDLKRTANDEAGDRLQIIGGLRTLKFTYWTRIESLGAHDVEHSLIFKARCIFSPKHFYMASVRRGRLAIVDVGEAALPPQPFFNSSEYAQVIEQRKAAGIPLSCEQPEG